MLLKTVILSCLGALVMGAGPALAQSADIDALYAQAVRDRVAGRNADAVEKLERVLAGRSDDVDARLNLGLALLAEGRLDEADVAFSKVISQAPAYADAHVGRARVAQRQGDLEAARAAALLAGDLRPDDPEVVALQRELAAGEKDESFWRMDVGSAKSALSRGLPSWREEAVVISRGLASGSVFGVAIERTRRFSRTDVFVEGRYDLRLASGGAYIALGGAPDADHRPEIALRAGGERLFGWEGLALTLDGGVARYSSGTVISLQPGLAQTLFRGRLLIGARWINVRDEQDDYRSGYSARAIWTPTPRLRLRAQYADAPESSDGVTVEVRAVSLGTDVDLTDRLTVRVNGLHEDREAYDRDELAVGLGWRF